jgi:hypothetical protein
MSAQVFITAGQNQIHGPSLQPNPNATQRPRQRFEYVVVNDSKLRSAGSFLRQWPAGHQSKRLSASIRQFAIVDIC